MVSAASPSERDGWRRPGEIGHWEILGKLNERAGEPEIGGLVEWALPIQQRHLSAVREGSLSLAAEEDPNG